MKTKTTLVTLACATLALLAGGWSYAQFNGLLDGTFPYCPDVNGQHLNWNGNLPGGGPVCGSSGPADTPPAFGSPTSRSLSLGTAYQASDPTKPAFVTITLASTASLTLSGGTSNTAQIVIGSTNAVASGTGSTVGGYANSQTGGVVVGVSLNANSTISETIALPAGWYFAIRQTAGTVSISSAFDQSVG